MMTPWNANASRIERGTAVTDDFSTKKPVISSFEISFNASLNKLLNKKSSSRLFETPWHSCNITIMSAHLDYISILLQCTDEEFHNLINLVACANR